MERWTSLLTYISFALSLRGSPSFLTQSHSLVSTMSTSKHTTNDVAIEQQAAEQLHVEIIPGTEVMTDVGNSDLAKAGGNGSVYVTVQAINGNERSAGEACVPHL